MKLSITPPAFLLHTRKYLRPIIKRHYFVFLLFILSGLIIVVYRVNQTLAMPTDQTYRHEKESTSINTNFDQATIERIESLQRSSESTSNQPLPSGRINPFVE